MAYEIEGKDEKESITHSVSSPHSSASSNTGDLMHDMVSRNDCDEQV